MDQMGDIKDGKVFNMFIAYHIYHTYWTYIFFNIKLLLIS
jgi:hypothetical protein